MGPPKLWPCVDQASSYWHADPKQLSDAIRGEVHMYGASRAARGRIVNAHRDFHNKVVAWDASIVLFVCLARHHEAYGRSLLAKDLSYVSIVAAEFKEQWMAQINAGLRPLLVFDGDKLPAKYAQQDRRRAKRADAIRFLVGDVPLSDDMRSKFEKGAIGVSTELIDVVINDARADGLPYICSPYEADAQCAILQRLGVAYVVYSADADMLAYGVTRLMRRYRSSTGVCQVYSSESLERGSADCPTDHPTNTCRCDIVLKLYRVWGADVFKVYAAIGGSDYDKFDGWASAAAIAVLKLAQKHKSTPTATQLLAFMKRVKPNCPMPSDAVARMTQVFSVYNEQVIYHPGHHMEMSFKHALHIGIGGVSPNQQSPTFHPTSDACGTVCSNSDNRVCNVLEPNGNFSTPPLTLTLAQAKALGFVRGNVSNGASTPRVPTCFIVMNGSDVPSQLPEGVVPGSMLTLADFENDKRPKKEAMVAFVKSRAWTNAYQASVAGLRTQCVDLLNIEKGIRDKSKEEGKEWSPYIRDQAGFSALHYLVRLSTHTVVVPSQYQHDKYNVPSLPTDGWINGVPMSKGIMPLLGMDMVRSHFMHRDTDSGLDSRVIKIGFAHLINLKQLDSFRIHMHPGVPNVYVQQVNVHARLAVHRYRVTIFFEYSDASVTPVGVTTKILRAVCEPFDGPACKASGAGLEHVSNQCTHVSMALQINPNMNRPDGYGSSTTPTQRHCVWNQPTEGHHYPDDTLLSDMVFARAFFDQVSRVNNRRRYQEYNNDKLPINSKSRANQNPITNGKNNRDNPQRKFSRAMLCAQLRLDIPTHGEYTTIVDLDDVGDDIHPDVQNDGDDDDVAVQNNDDVDYVDVDVEVDDEVDEDEHGDYDDVENDYDDDEE
eukprot:m.77919 g.77919  ORF g.77919 m.77919 type:complete len:885 (-) comp25062_c0_seq4:106-2760(-)